MHFEQGWLPLHLALRILQKSHARLTLRTLDGVLAVAVMERSCEDGEMLLSAADVSKLRRRRGVATELDRVRSAAAGRRRVSLRLARLCMASWVTLDAPCVVGDVCRT